jgi:hypothetical protein
VPPGQPPAEAAASRPGAGPERPDPDLAPRRDPPAAGPGGPGDADARRDPQAAGPGGPGDADARRDRDAAGRARNARPRDGLGRPLERGADGEPPAPDAPALPPAEALDAAQRLLDAGRPFHAHEVLEAAWKAAPAAERDLWQGLAQLAVGLTHALRGNAGGAAALLRRGASRVSRYQPARPHGVDTAGLVAAATALADRIEAGGLGTLPPGLLDLRLRGPARGNRS